MGQDVVVRFRYDRLEILPRSSPELLRDKLLGHVADNLDAAIQKLESVVRFGPPAASKSAAGRKGSAKKRRL